MIVGIPRETFPGETRVALTPQAVATLAKAGHTLHVETGAGLQAGFPDSEYESKGAKLFGDRAALLAGADLICQVRTLGMNPQGQADVAHHRPGQTVIGFADPLLAPEANRTLTDAKINLFAVELIPRITRAQAMDALSSQANLAGYQAVLLGAMHLPRVLPMMTTAAGTIQPARILILGAGVAGLQAIATSRRLGSVVWAYDVRPAVKEQVLSLGAKFVEIPVVAAQAEDKGGYAKEQSAEQLQKQREALTKALSDSDLVITTAAVPGKKSPVLVTEEMVQQMKACSVIVDLAAERGGNCALTEADKTVTRHGVTIIGATNLPAQVPYHASQTYANNLVKLIQHLCTKEGNLAFDLSDEITSGSLVCREGEIVQPQVRQAMGLSPLEPPSPPATPPVAEQPQPTAT